MLAASTQAPIGITGGFTAFVLIVIALFGLIVLDEKYDLFGVAAGCIGWLIIAAAFAAMGLVATGGIALFVVSFRDNNGLTLMLGLALLFIITPAILFVAGEPLLDIDFEEAGKGRAYFVCLGVIALLGGAFWLLINA